MSDTLVMGAVAYDPKVVTIWDGFRTWLRGHGLRFEYLLYPHYEMQVEDLVEGRIQAAWNSPLAWIRAQRLATFVGETVLPLVMRDTDRDLTSVVVVRHESAVQAVTDLDGRLVGTGAVDSPQATLIPLRHLARAGVRVRRRAFNVGVGLHGDHVGGERDAARALMAGEVDAAAMLDANHLLFIREGVLPPDGTRIVSQTPPYDHCNMTVVDGVADDLVKTFGELLSGMTYADPDVRRLLDLEGLTSWESGRTNGYRALEEAVDWTAFYGPGGEMLMTDYQP
jgi:ABC-type phosphate/phosphonate transport system substrate-binding protein